MLSQPSTIAAHDLSPLPEPLITDQPLPQTLPLKIKELIELLKNVDRNSLS
jgi:hypothetical protein